MMPHDFSEDHSKEINDQKQAGSVSEPPILAEYHITVPPLLEGLIQERVPVRRRLLDFLKAAPSVEWIKTMKLPSPMRMFQETIDEREAMSVSAHSSAARLRHFHMHFIRKINWSSLFTLCKNWLQHPVNIALVIWLLCVAASGAMLVLLLLGVLNKAFPSKSSRHHWIEINNQVLNALFTLISIYQHPNLLHHVVLLCRWRPDDITELQKVYCKNNAYRPREWAHITVVVLLLHIACISQYVVCSLYWGYSRERPELVETFFFILGITATVTAGIYTVYSPLGREVDAASDEGNAKPSETRAMVISREWAGSLFACSEDHTVCCLSCLCTFCVFGWNVERLGFGNMYVHAVMLLLLCIAPFWVFNVTALNLHDYVLGDVFGTAGVALCFFGLLYGGFWRVQVRKKLGLPGSRLCCGSAALSDYVQWLFCWPCALAQEVRTGNLYAKLLDDGLEEGSGPMVAPGSLIGEDTREDGMVAVDDVMTPPVQPVMRPGDKQEIRGVHGLASSEAED